MKLEKPCHTGGRTSSTNRKMIRKMWVLWHGPIPEGKWLLHHCDVGQCDEITHLYLGTPKDNTRDMDSRRRGVRCRGKSINEGVNNGRAKLTPEDVREIRELIETMSTASLASIYEVSPTAISNVVHRRTWKKVK